MARHFRTGIDTMIREAELEEMEKKWAAENQRIMSEHPAAAAPSEPSEPAAASVPAAVPAAATLPDDVAPGLFAPSEVPPAPVTSARRPGRKKAAP